jgi:2-iminobutanoate/2-iminopropanoate deaminase
MPGGIAAETPQTLENIKPILAEAGAMLYDTVPSTVRMVDLAEFAKMNKGYAEYFTVMPPRSSRDTSRLPVPNAADFLERRLGQQQPLVRCDNTA